MNASGRRRPGWWAPGAGLAGGLLIDRLVGDPRRGHPVAAFGRTALATERVLYDDARLRGALHTGLLAGGAAGLGAVAQRLMPGPASLGALTAAATWAVVGGTTLRAEAAAMSALIGADEIESARARLSHLCGRDASALDAEGLARATVESVAENTSDAVVGPLVWGAVLGVPGMLGYRAVNTLDAMVGHRSAHYARFGWASARADDLANLVPARLSALLTTRLAPLVGGTRAHARSIWRRDGAKHPSPNAGQVEAAFAGALGRRLGGPVAYDGRSDPRTALGDGPAPAPADIARAVRLSAGVSTACAVLAVAVRLVIDGRRR